MSGIRGEDSNSDADLVGFLCIDNPKRKIVSNIFNKEADLLLMTKISTLLFPVISEYYEEIEAEYQVEIKAEYEDVLQRVFFN